MSTRMWSILVLCLTAAAAARASPVGQLAGRITDESGQALAGVLVTVSGPGAVGRYNTRTDASGSYRFMALPTYEPLDARAETSGRLPVVYKGLTVREGSDVRRDFRLRPPGWRDVLILVDRRVPYHSIALEGARSTVSGGITLLELSGNRRLDERRLRQAARQQPNAVLAIGTLAARLARREVRDSPVVYAMVLDPQVEDLQSTNLCGLTLNGGFPEQLRILSSLKPDARRLVTIYDPRRLASDVSRLRGAASERGMRLLARPARNAGEVISALDSLQEGAFDAFFLLLDPDLFDAGGFERVRRFAANKNLIFIVPDSSLVAVGGTFSYGPGFREMGAYAGKLVTHLFSGAAEPSDISVRFPTARYLSLNPVETERLGLLVPEEWISSDRAGHPTRDPADSHSSR